MHYRDTLPCETEFGDYLNPRLRFPREEHQK